MNIYEAEGTDAIVDLRRAAAELKTSSSITNEISRKATVAEIQTAALLDIALSLRVVAAEARAAMPDVASLFTPEGGPAEAEFEKPSDFFIEGDIVIVDGSDEPAEIKSFGQSEGALYANLLLADGSEARAWVETLSRVDAEPDDTPAEVTLTDGTPAPKGADGIPILISAEPDDGVPIGELVDDIDGDFEGDPHSAAASALDVLKANEAERKAAKKGKKK